MKKHQWINTAAFIGMLLIEGIAELIPIGGRTGMQVYDLYPAAVVPAPVTFVVRGIIDLLLGVFVLYQWGLFGSRRRSAAVRDRIGYLFAVSCALNAARSVLRHLDLIGASAIAAFCLAAVLILIETVLKDSEGSMLEQAAARTGFDLFTGFAAFSALADLGVLTYKLGWRGTGAAAQLWAVILLSAATAAGVLLLLRYRSPMMGIAVMWGLTGILFRHLSDAGYARAYPFALAASMIGIMILLSVIDILLYRDIAECRQVLTVQGVRR